jgi:predicted extracellular nuclease
MKGFLPVLSLILLIATGCDSGGGGGPADDTFTPGWETHPGDTAPEVDVASPPGQDTRGDAELPPVGPEWTIETCQTHAGGPDCVEGSDFVDLAEGVELDGVLVATEIFAVSDKLEGFFVHDGVGGPWSGLMVVFDRGMVSGLKIGQHVAVSGDLMEYYCNTQLNAASVVVGTETPAPPAPTVIAAGDVVSAGGGQSEDYEGCLVSLSGIQVVAVDPAHNTFTLEGGLVVDDKLYAFDRPAAGCVYESVTGIIQYSFGEYVLLPRTPSDLVGDGSPACGGTPPQIPESVFDVQNSELSKTCSEEAFVDGGSVSLTGVVVTTPAMSISSGKFRAYHVQEPEGGPWSGILVLFEADGNPPSLKVGDVLDVSGDWTEYYCLSEIRAAAWTLHLPWTGSHHPGAVDPTVLATAAPGAEAWEGVLVAVEDATVASVDQYGDLILQGSGLRVDNEFVGAFEVQPGATFSTILGVVYYTFEEYRLLPRSLDDLLK